MSGESTFPCPPTAQDHSLTDRASLTAQVAKMRLLIGGPVYRREPRPESTWQSRTRAREEEEAKLVGRPPIIISLLQGSRGCVNFKTISERSKQLLVAATLHCWDLGWVQDRLGDQIRPIFTTSLQPQAYRAIEIGD